MIVSIALLIGLSASFSWSQNFVCGFEPEANEVSAEQEVRGRSGSGGTSEIRALILFGKFKNSSDPFSLTGTALTDENNASTRSVSHLLDMEINGSVTHYFHEMSYGKLTIQPPSASAIMTTWHQTKGINLSDYGIGEGCANGDPTRPCATDPNIECDRVNDIWVSGVKKFVNEVMDAVDGQVNFNDFDIIAVTIPEEFENACKVGGTVYTNAGEYDGASVPNVIITDQGDRSFPGLVGVIAHEYGHVLGLPELYDRSNHKMPIDLPSHSAGIGYWGVMGGGAYGWQRQQAGRPDGPSAMTAWSRMKAGWLTPSTISGPGTDFRLEDINGGDTNAYKIEISDSEYFLIANRQNSYPDVDNFFEKEAKGAGGLAIWHVDDNAGWYYPDRNEFERHKRLDLESWDGLYSDRPGGVADNVSGGDNLDFFHSVEDERFNPQQFGGNRGDATDLWDGTSGRQTFTPTSNPSTAGYEPWQRPATRFPQPISRSQNVFSGIHIENIRKVADETTVGLMAFDVRLAPLAPRDLEAALGEDRIQFSWKPPNSIGATVASYKVKYRPKSSSDSGWSDDITLEPSVTTYTVTDLALNTDVTLSVSAVSTRQNNLDGLQGAATELTARTQEGIDGPSHPPDFPEIKEKDINTIWQRPVAKYAKTGIYLWSISGDDHWAFLLEEVTGGFRELHFRSPPNFERPVDRPLAPDGDGDNIYHIVINANSDESLNRAPAPSTRYMKPITVRVTNVEENGTVTLSTTDPEAGQPTTASLRDPDEHVPPVDWQWHWDRESTGFGHPQQIQGATSSFYSPVGTDVGKKIFVTATYTDGHSDNRDISTSASTNEVAGPTILGPPEIQFAENRDASVATYTAKNADETVPTSATWSLADSDDDDAFTINQSGKLSFVSLPNYESPSATGHEDSDPLADRNVYSVTVQVEIGGVTVGYPVEVTVTDVDERGVITIQPNLPVVHKTITATLVDPDGIENLRWSWPGYQFDDFRSTEQEFDTTLRKQTIHVHIEALGRRLKARARYTDRHGDKSVFSDFTKTTLSAPSRPRDLQVTAGNGKVYLTWEPPALTYGLPITGYGYRQDSDGTTVKGTMPVGTSHTIEGLTNGTSYRFKIWAINRAGRGFGTDFAPAVTPGPSAASFASAPYEAPEGGDAVTVTVGLSPAAGEAAEIPVTVTPDDGTETGDYTVTWPGTAGTLSFSSDAASQSLTIGAAEDADRDDETLSLAFGTLPDGVVSGTPATAVVTLKDNKLESAPENQPPNRPVGRTAISFAENSSDSVATYELTDPDGNEGLSLVVGGDDLSAFEASGDTLYFRPSPDWENPADDDDNNVYVLSLKTSDGLLTSLALPVTVTVTDQGPGVPVVTLGTPTTTTLPVTWTATGSGLAGFELQHCSSCGPNSDWTLVTVAGGSTRSHTLDNLESNTEYSVRLRAKDSAGEYSAWSQVKSKTTATTADEELEITGSRDWTFLEHGIGIVATFRTTGADGAVTWSIDTGQQSSNADRGDFTMGRTTGRLSFISAPNFEEPDDADEDNIYKVTVKATDSGTPAASDTHPVSVEVTNKDEAGSASLQSTDAQVGREVRVEIRDPDGSVDVRSEQWQSKLGSGNWQDISESSSRAADERPELVTLWPTVDLAGKKLRVVVGYLDRESSDNLDLKPLTSDETNAVRHRALSVEFASSSYSATEGGSPQTVRVNVSPTADRTLRLPITFTGAERSAEEHRSSDYTTNGLDGRVLVVSSGNSFATFQIAATADDDRNDETLIVGFGPLPAEVSAGSQATTSVELVDTTPVTDQGPGVPVVTLGTPTTTTLPVTWTATGSGLAGFELQHCSSCGPNSDWTLVTVAGGSTRSHTLDNLESNTEYSVRLRAKDSAGEYSAWSQVKSKTTATTADEELEITGSRDWTFLEHGIGIVATFRTTGADGAVTWSIDTGQQSSNADRGDFTMGRTTGRLSFISAPNFEEPDDADEDNIYKVTVKATDSGTPAASDTHPVSVEVTNKDEAGSASLQSTDAQVGREVRVEIRDPDGSVDVRSEQWQSKLGSGNWQDISESSSRAADERPELVTLWPTVDLAGKKLRVVVGYLDRESSDNLDLKPLTSDETNAVRHRALSVEFASSSYSATEGGSPQTVRVNVSPTADRTLRLPITFTGAERSAEEHRSSDYTTNGLDGRVLVVSSGNSFATFQIAATADDDRNDETLIVGFGPLPAEVSAGSQATTSVELVDTTSEPNQAPTISAIGTITVAENSTPVTTAHATDPEDDQLSWTVTPSGTFSITSLDRNRGRVSFKAAPNYESGNTSYDVTVEARDSHGNTDTEEFTVRVNDVSEPPGTPDIQSVTATSRTSLNVRWTAPDMTGKPALSEYHIQYRKASVSSWSSHPFADTGTQATISSLEPGTAYKVRVKASNDEGNSPWDEATGSTQSNAAPVVTGPTSVTGAEGATGILATYRKSDADGDATQWLSLGGTDFTFFNFSSSGELRFANPPDYETQRSYSVRIGATDSYDNTYLPVTVTLRNIEPPATPSLSISRPSSNGHKQLNLSWSVTSSSTSAPVTGWRLLHCTGHCKSFTEAGWTARTFSASTTSTTLTGLKSGTQYFARVKATSNEGDSPFSSVQSGYTADNTAPVISGPSRQNVNENTTSVATYTATDAEGDAITWDLYSTDSGKFSFTSSGSNLELSFKSAPDYENPTDANTNNIYAVRVRVTDDGDPSESSNKLVNAVVQDIGPPEKMATPTVSVPSSGTGRLRVTWSAPASDAPISGYILEHCYAPLRSASDEDSDSDSDEDSNEPRTPVCEQLTFEVVTSTTLTGLHGNTLYTVRMKARSGEGDGSWSTAASAITRSIAAKALAEQMTLNGLEGLAALVAPNPFNPATTIWFQITEPENVSLAVYNTAGQVVRRLVEGRDLQPGIYDVLWDGKNEQGSDAGSGVYLFRLQAGEQVLVQKMTLLR